MIALRNGVERRVVHPAGWSRSPNPYSYAIRSGDTLFLSGLVPRSVKDNSTVGSDIASQTTAIFRNAADILEAAGMTLTDVVSSRVYLTDVANLEGMNRAYRSSFPAAPPTRATVRAGLTKPEYLVEITMTAVAHDVERRAVTTPAADGSPGRPNPNLSSAIRAGGRLFVSGMLGASERTRGDAAGQTREALDRIARTLRAADFAAEDVVDATVYLPRAGDFAAMNAAYRAAFGKPMPARATVVAGLVAADALVEIAVTAVKGGGRPVE